MDPECKLRRTEDDKLVTVAPQSLALRYLKWECPDGTYRLAGPGVDLLLVRKDGVVYPAGGKIDPANLEGLQAQNPNPEEN